MLMQNNWHSKKEKFCSFFVEIYLQYKKVIKYSLLSKYWNSQEIGKTKKNNNR